MVALVQGVVISHWPKLLRSTVVTTACFLARAVIDPQWLKGLLEFSVGPPGAVSRDQGRQQSLSDLHTFGCGYHLQGPV